MTLGSQHPLQTRKMQFPGPRGGLSRLSYYPERLEDARREGSHDPEVRGPKVR